VRPPASIESCTRSPVGGGSLEGRFISGLRLSSTFIMSTASGSDDSAEESRSPEINLPSKLPPPTGDLVHDSIESAKHITEIPCARKSLMTGIVSGAGIGVIRGIAAGPRMGGNWAVATFALVSVASWHICQMKLENERRQMAQIIESMPKRKLKEGGSPNP